LRPGSVQRTVIAGHEAMVAIGEYQTEQGAEVEYMTWIYTERTHTFFFARLAADDLEVFRPQFERFVESASIP
jgi:hypothetical protein